MVFILVSYYLPKGVEEINFREDFMKLRKKLIISIRANKTIKSFVK
jgi:hypothetical protein